MPAPTALRRRDATRPAALSRTFSAAVLVIWLGASYLIAGWLGDWAALHTWLFLSVWMLCASLLLPVVVRALRVPVGIFERSLPPAAEAALPPGLSAALNAVLADTRTLIVTLEVETSTVEAVEQDLWRWTQLVDGLPEVDRAVLEQLGLGAGPVLEHLRPPDEGQEGRGQPDGRDQILDILTHFESALLRHRPAVYR